MEKRIRKHTEYWAVCNECNPHGDIGGNASDEWVSGRGPFESRNDAHYALKLHDKEHVRLRRMERLRQRGELIG